MSETGDASQQPLQSAASPADSEDVSTGGWLVLVYRVPSEPSSKRVAIWRDLKRVGAHYLQQCVCVVPRRPDLHSAIETIREKIGGSAAPATCSRCRGWPPRMRAGADRRLPRSSGARSTPRSSRSARPSSSRRSSSSVPRELHLRRGRGDPAGPGEDPPLVRPRPGARLVRRTRQDGRRGADRSLRRPAGGVLHRSPHPDPPGAGTSPDDHEVSHRVQAVAPVRPTASPRRSASRRKEGPA